MTGRLKRQIVFFTITFFLILVESTEISANEIWTLTTAPYNSWVAVAGSADGNTLAAVSDGGSIYISTNSGAAWTQATNAPGDYWTCICISDDGSKIAAGIDGGLIYVSQDFGVKWRLTSAPPNYWECITCSADGKKLAAAAYSDGLDNNVPGQIHLSTDWGHTWKTPHVAQNSKQRQFWLAITSSFDGSKLAAVDAGGSIYTSKDSGLSWKLTGAPNESWFGIASSTNGNKLVAVANAGPIYTSVNGGLTWIAATNAPNAGWASVASSSDGKKLAAVQWGGQIYTSADSGISWSQNSLPNTFSAGGLWGIASSQDGSKILAAGDGIYGGPIYLFQPTPILDIANNDTNVIVSWPCSATGFVLKKNSDLTTPNWTDAGIIPKVVNGRNQMKLPRVGMQFYRLEFPTGTAPWWSDWPPFVPPLDL